MISVLLNECGIHVNLWSSSALSFLASDFKCALGCCVVLLCPVFALLRASSMVVISVTDSAAS